MQFRLGHSVVLLVLLLVGCTTADEIKRPEGKTRYIVSCGAAVGWNVCDRRANEVCPDGYRVISKDAGHNRKELVIECGK